MVAMVINYQTYTINCIVYFHHTYIMFTGYFEMNLPSNTKNTLVLQLLLPRLQIVRAIKYYSCFIYIYVDLLCRNFHICVLHKPSHIGMVAMTVIVTRPQMKVGNSDWYGRQLGYF